MSLSRSDAGHLGSLTSRLNEQRKSGGAFCDVLLKVCGQTLPTHGCVLSACSPFFHGLICADRPQAPHLTPVPQEIELRIPASCVDNTPDTATTPDAGLETVLQLLDYIYTGRIELSEGSVHLMVKLAEALALDGLTVLLSNYVSCAGKDYEIDAAVEAKPASSKKGRGRLSSSTPTQTKRKRKAPPRKLPVAGTSTKSTSSKCELEEGTDEQGVSVTEIMDDVDQGDEVETRAEPTPRALRSRRRGARVDSSPPTYEEDGDGEDQDPSSDNFALHKRNRNRAKKHTFKCGQCEFVSSDAMAVREHKQIHGRSKSFVCLTCGYFSGYCTKMLSHLRTANHAETKCSLCGVECADREAFSEHLRKHENLKPFFCQLCDKRYRSQCLLARHLARHSADRPFVCDVCGRGFKNKHFMLIHVSNHSAVKMFACPQCDYRTSFKTNLNMHVRIHREGKLQCPREGCKFQSISKYNLQSHLLTHAKQKPYQCEVCGQKFAQERSRRRHAKIHNPDSMLRCDRCQFATVSRYRLSEHVYKVHENGPPIPSKRVRKPRGEQRQLAQASQQQPPPPPQLPPPHPTAPGGELQQQHQVRKVHDMGGPSLATVTEHVRMAYQDCQPVLGGLEMYTPRMWFP